MWTCLSDEGEGVGDVGTCYWAGGEEVGKADGYGARFAHCAGWELVYCEKARRKGEVT